MKKSFFVCFFFVVRMRVAASVAIPILCSMLVVLSLAQAPAGLTVFFNTQQCPPSWYEYEPAKGRLVLSVVDPVQGGTTLGESLAAATAPTHSHPYQVTVTLQEKNIAADSCCNSQGACNGAYVVKNTTTSNNSGVPFTQAKLCTLNATDSSISIPFGTVAFFDPSIQSCPTNWTLFTESDGRFIIGGWEVKGTTSSDAPAMAYGSDISHTHIIDGTQNSVSIANVEYAGIDGCCNDELASSGTVPVSGNTDAESANIPYIQLLTCISQEKTLTSTNLPNTAMLYNTVGCPDDWKVNLDIAGRFLVGLPEAGVAGAAFGGDSLPAAYSGPAGTHSHDFTGSFTTDDCEVGLISGCCSSGYARNQEYDFQGFTNSSTVDLPYLTVPLCTYVGSK